MIMFRIIQWCVFPYKISHIFGSQKVHGQCKILNTILFIYSTQIVYCTFQRNINKGIVFLFFQETNLTNFYAQTHISLHVYSNSLWHVLLKGKCLVPSSKKVYFVLFVTIRPNCSSLLLIFTFFSDQQLLNPLIPDMEVQLKRFTLRSFCFKSI